MSLGEYVNWFTGVVFALGAAGWAVFIYLRSNRSAAEPVIPAKLLLHELKASEQEKADLRRELEAARDALAGAAAEPGSPYRAEDAQRELAQGRPETAQAIFLAIARRHEAKGQSENQRAAAHYRHAGALAYLHDTQAALDAYERATALDPADPAGWNMLGHLGRRAGDLPRAEEAYGRVLKIGEQTKDKHAQASAYGNLGIVYFTRGDLERAEEMYGRALALDTELGRKEGMANAYGNLGNVYLNRKELQRAEEMQHKALALHTELGRKEGMAYAYGNLGNVYFNRGDLERAEEMYGKALALHTELGHKEGMATAYGNLGNVYRIRRELDRAEEMYGKALGLFEALGSKEGMANSYGNLGNVYFTRGDLARAEESVLKGLALAREMGAQPLIEQLEADLAKVRGARR